MIALGLFYILKNNFYILTEQFSLKIELKSLNKSVPQASTISKYFTAMV